MSFWKYLSKQIPGHYQWGRRVPLDSLMSYSRSLDEPLQLLPKTQDILSLTAFKEILKYCGDVYADDTQRVEARNKLIKIAISKSTRVKDEIILLLIKQTRKNGDPESVLRVFRLLAIVVSIIKPSKELTLPLMNWLYNVVEHHKNEEYKNWARYILFRVYKNSRLNDTRVFMPNTELLYIENMKKIKIYIFTLNGAFIECYIESYTTFAELKFLVMQQLRTVTKHHWRLGFLEQVRYKDKIEERFMEDHHCVMDIICSWESLSKSVEKGSFKMARLFFVHKCAPVDLESTDSDDQANLQSMIFLLFTYQLISSKFLISNTDMVKLATLHIIRDHGMLSDYEGSGKLKLLIKQYIPLPYFEREKMTKWIEDVRAEMSRIEKEWRKGDKLNRSLQERAMNEYMDHIKGWPALGAHFFPAKYRDSNSTDIQGIPEEVIFVIRPLGIQILEADTLELFMEYDFMEITNWGCAERIFVLSLGEIHAIKKLYFIANQAPMMAWILNQFAGNMANKVMDRTSLINKFDFNWNKRKRLCSSFPYKEVSDIQDLI